MQLDKTCERIIEYIIIHIKKTLHNTFTKMYMIYDNAITPGDIKTLTKYSIIFTLWKFNRKMQTQRNPGKAVDTENADNSCFYPKEN